MGRVVGFILLGILGVSFASAQDIPPVPRLWYGALTTGYAGTEERHSFSTFWVVAPATEQAALVGQVLGLGANPITSGWAQYAIGEQRRSIPMAGEPAERVNLQGGALAMYGGNLPFKPWNYVNPPPENGQAAGANAAGGNLQRLMTTTEGLPLISTALQLGNSLEDSSVEVSISCLDEPLSVGANLPPDGWWLLTLEDSSITTGNDQPRDWPNRSETWPFMIGSSNTEGSNALPGSTWIPSATPGTVATPEPGTLMLGLAGLAGTWFYRRRSTKST